MNFQPPDNEDPRDDDQRMQDAENAGASRLKACDDLLQAAHAFWKSERQAGQYGAVKWLQGDDGSLVIFTRGEYRARLMAAIGDVEDVVHSFAPAQPSPSDEMAFLFGLREVLDVMPGAPASSLADMVQKRMDGLRAARRGPPPV